MGSSHREGARKRGSWREGELERGVTGHRHCVHDLQTRERERDVAFKVCQKHENKRETREGRGGRNMALVRERVAASSSERERVGLASCGWNMHMSSMHSTSPAILLFSLL
jgi:hypothetical protein